MQFAYSVYCLQLQIFMFMDLMRKKLKLMLDIASICLRLQKFTVRQLSVKINRISRDWNLLVRSYWLKKIVEKLRSRENIKLVLYGIVSSGYCFCCLLLLTCLWKQLERRKQEDELKQVMQQEQHLERIKVYFVICQCYTSQF